MKAWESANFRITIFDYHFHVVFFLNITLLRHCFLFVLFFVFVFYLSSVKGQVSEVVVDPQLSRCRNVFFILFVILAALVDGST